MGPDVDRVSEKSSIGRAFPIRIAPKFLCHSNPNPTTMKLNPYLTFNGNCKAAFDYYVKNLGAKLVMSMTYADAPPSPEDAQPGCRPDSSNKIMHARIEIGDNVLMGSDSPPERFQAAAGIFISLNTKDEKEAECFYAALADKGQVIMPLEETFWAHRFAMLQDQFGIPWMINCEKEKF
jgi:PhnB protein